MSRSFSVLALAALPAIGGCVAAVATTAAVGAGAVGLAASQERSIGGAVDDGNLTRDVKLKLLNAETGNFLEVDVEVYNRVVLLSGRVDTPEERIAAERMAWTANMTRDVANEIKIEGRSGWQQDVGDEIISNRVRARLLGSSSVRARNFNVETYGGTVYLMGIARSEEELRKAAEEASYVGGVKEVVSYIELRDPPPAERALLGGNGDS